VLVCWLSLKPSNDRNWQSNLPRTPWAEISGDRVTIHNFRHSYYLGETEFTCKWLTKEVSLSQVRSVDFFVDYWNDGLSCGHWAHCVGGFGKLGLAVLRTAWFNLDLLWAAALVVSSVVILLM
jgi:hypothetical protein